MAASAATRARGCRAGCVQSVSPGLRRREHALGRLPFFEERLHVGDEVFDDREVRERADLPAAAARHLGHVGAAGPARLPVHRHGAGAAHSDAAGKTVRQGGVDVALDVSHDGDHGLALAPGHAIGLVASVAAAAPERDLQFRGRLPHRAPFAGVSKRRRSFSFPPPIACHFCPPRGRGPSFPAFLESVRSPLPELDPRLPLTGG